jgi:5'-nucleotidase
MKRILYLVVALAVVGLAIPVQGVGTEPDAGADLADRPAPDRVVDLQILALNDFHGQLEPVPPSTSQGTPQLGGVAHLATLVREHRAENPKTVFVSAGDLIGASPLISALFHDEPSIEAFNMMDLDFNAVGNHEFDEGAAELLRMQKGGCHPVDGCLDGDDFPGADFRFLAANVLVENTGRTLFPGVGFYDAGGVKVAFIGMTLEGTPTIVTPSGVAGLDFQDEADTANALIESLRLRHRVDIIVVLIHEGGAPSQPFPYDGCAANGISGAIVDIVERTSDEVDLFITGHTHNAYICEIDGRPVTSSLSFSRVLTDIDVSYDPVADRIVDITIDNIPVVTTGTPAPDLEALVAKYKDLSAPLANRVIGSITADITRTANAAGESALGDVIADAQLLATSPVGFGEAVIGFMNPGGIRADMLFANSPGGEAPGEITYGEAFSVQPFGNSLVTMTLTGQQIKDVLEQQFDNPAVGQNRIMQVSNGFTYTWTLSAPTGSKVSNMALNGVAIDLGATYRVTVNSFMAEGGDNFTVLRDGTDRLGGALDLDALEAYFMANSPVAPGPQNRITQLP